MMGSPEEQQRIDAEIQRLEVRRAEMERRLKTQTSANFQNTLEHIANMDRTLVSLRQQRVREFGNN